MPSRVFSLPDFDKFLKKAKLSEERLIEAVDRADGGKVYADLGEGVIKQAVGRPNEGARSGFRTILGFQAHFRAFFLFGFAKNDTENINKAVLKDYRVNTEKLMALNDEALDAIVEEGVLREIVRPLAEAEEPDAEEAVEEGDE